MTSPYYLELIPDLIEETVAAAEFIGSSIYRTLKSGGWAVDYAAPGQNAAPAFAQMRDIGRGERFYRALQVAAETDISPKQALLLLMQRLADRNGRQDTRQASASLRSGPGFTREALRTLARLAPAEFDAIDPDYRLRLTVYGDPALLKRLERLQAQRGHAAYRLMNLQTPPGNLPVPRQMPAPAPARGGARKKRFEQNAEPQPFAA